MSISGLMRHEPRTDCHNACWCLKRLKPMTDLGPEFGDHDERGSGGRAPSRVQGHSLWSDGQLMQSSLYIAGCLSRYHKPLRPKMFFAKQKICRTFGSPWSLDPQVTQTTVDVIKVSCTQSWVCVTWLYWLTFILHVIAAFHQQLMPRQLHACLTTLIIPMLYTASRPSQTAYKTRLVLAMCPGI